MPQGEIKKENLDNLLNAIAFGNCSPDQSRKDNEKNFLFFEDEDKGTSTEIKMRRNEKNLLD